MATVHNHSEESVDPVLMTISQGALECIKVMTHSCTIVRLLLYCVCHTAQVLLEKGVSHECTDNNGMQPIHWALQCSSMCTKY